MNSYMVQKTSLVSTRYWIFKITLSKYYGMYILRLYTMELKCLHINTSYSVTEVFLCLNMLKSIIEECLQYKCQHSLAQRSRGSVVGIATGYGLYDRGVAVRIPVGSRIFSFPRLPHRLWGSPNLLSNGYRGLFLGDKAARA
jgi:hypothetical protein